MVEATTKKEVVLEVEDLHTYFETRWGTVKAVDGVSFELRAGETLGIVGESGSGKTVTMLSLMRLVPIPPGRILDGGKIVLDGENLLELSEEEMTKIRGSKIALIIQDPMTSLNPVFTIGNQVAESIKIHQNPPRATVLEKVLDVLRKVNIPAAETRVRDYPPPDERGDAATCGGGYQHFVPANGPHSGRAHHLIGCNHPSPVP